ncbi:hypothetical protein XGA_2735 [Xanthomonas hortorum ATCC 19865]|nr:hypothetical protein XGA_2735 [Xanthomonas hortorum ATCC 19865]
MWLDAKWCWHQRSGTNQRLDVADERQRKIGLLQRIPWPRQDLYLVG